MITIFLSNDYEMTISRIYSNDKRSSLFVTIAEVKSFASYLATSYDFFVK
jgi:hypothetical protein